MNNYVYQPPLAPVWQQQPMSPQQYVAPPVVDEVRMIASTPAAQANITESIQQLQTIMGQLAAGYNDGAKSPLPCDAQVFDTLCQELNTPQVMLDLEKEIVNTFGAKQPSSNAIRERVIWFLNEQARQAQRRADYYVTNTNPSAVRQVLQKRYAKQFTNRKGVNCAFDPDFQKQLLSEQGNTTMINQPQGNMNANVVYNGMQPGYVQPASFVNPNQVQPQQASFINNPTTQFQVPNQYGSTPAYSQNVMMPGTQPQFAANGAQQMLYPQQAMYQQAMPMMQQPQQAMGMQQGMLYQPLAPMAMTQGEYNRMVMANRILQNANSMATAANVNMNNANMNSANPMAWNPVTPVQTSMVLPLATRIDNLNTRLAAIVPQMGELLKIVIPEGVKNNSVPMLFSEDFYHPLAFIKYVAAKIVNTSEIQDLFGLQVEYLNKAADVGLLTQAESEYFRKNPRTVIAQVMVAYVNEWSSRNFMFRSFSEWCAVNQTNFTFATEDKEVIDGFHVYQQISGHTHRYYDYLEQMCWWFIQYVNPTHRLDEADSSITDPRTLNIFNRLRQRAIVEYPAKVEPVCEVPVQEDNTPQDHIARNGLGDEYLVPNCDPNRPYSDMLDEYSAMGCDIEKFITPHNGGNIHRRLRSQLWDSICLEKCRKGEDPAKPYSGIRYDLIRREELPPVETANGVKYKAYRLLNGTVTITPPVYTPAYGTSEENVGPDIVHAQRALYALENPAEDECMFDNNAVFTPSIPVSAVDDGPLNIERYDLGSATVVGQATKPATTEEAPQQQPMSFVDRLREICKSEEFKTTIAKLEATREEESRREYEQRQRLQAMSSGDVFPKETNPDLHYESPVIGNPVEDLTIDTTKVEPTPEPETESTDDDALGGEDYGFEYGKHVMTRDGNSDNAPAETVVRKTDKDDEHALHPHPEPVVYEINDLREPAEWVEVSENDVDMEEADKVGEIRYHNDITFFRTCGKYVVPYNKDEEINFTETLNKDDVESIGEAIHMQVSNDTPAFFGTDGGLESKIAHLLKVNEVHVAHADYKKFKELNDKIEIALIDPNLGEKSATPKQIVKVIDLIKKAPGNIREFLGNIIVDRFNDAAGVLLARKVKVTETNEVEHAVYFVDDLDGIDKICRAALNEENLDKDVSGWIDTESQDFRKALEQCLEYSFGAIWNRDKTWRDDLDLDEISKQHGYHAYLDPFTFLSDKSFLLTHRNAAIRVGPKGCTSGRLLVTRIREEDDNLSEDEKKELDEKLNGVCAIRVERKVLLHNFKNIPFDLRATSNMYVRDFADKQFLIEVYKRYGVVELLNLTDTEQYRNTSVAGYDLDNNIAIRRSCAMVNL